MRKRLTFKLFILFIALLVLPSVALGEAEENELGVPETMTTAQTDFKNMNEMQMAMTIINNQIEYLMKQIQDSEQQINRINELYEEKFQDERERLDSQLELLEKKLEESEAKLSAKEAEVRELQQQISELERKTAIFISESGLYLKVLIGFLIGTVVGIIIGGILHWWKRRGNQSTIAG